MDFNQLMGRLGRNGQVLVGGALLIFIFSFLPWYTASFTFLGQKSSGHAAAWHSGIGAWFPVLLLVAVGVVAVLWALEIVSWPALMVWTLAAGASILAAIIIILRWITFPSASSSGVAGYGVSGSAGAGWALYVSLVIAVAMAVFAYLGFTSAGGDIKNLGAAFAKPSQLPPSEG